MLELSRPQSDEAEAVIATFLPRHAWGEEAVRAFVQRLRKNKYPLLMLESAAARHPCLAKSVAWQSALAVDQSELDEQRSELVKVKRVWFDAGIPSVLFKSGGIEPSFPYTSDNVDVLVPRGRTREAREILMGLGYVWLHNIDEEQKWLFRKFRAGRSVSAIHVHGWVGWDVEFHERAIWDGIRQSFDDPEVMVPSREDALLINSAHALYENKEIRLYDLEKIRAQWGTGLDWQYIESIARRRGWLDGLYFALLVCQKLEREIYGYRTVPADVVRSWKEGLKEYRLQWGYWQQVKKRPLSLPFRVSFAFSKLLYYKKIFNDAHDGNRTKVSNLVRTLAWGVKQKSGIRPQPGRLIALSGLDGTGKTAHAKALSQAMDTSEVINRTVWSRAGCSPLFQSLVTMLRAAAPNIDKAVGAQHVGRYPSAAPADNASVSDADLDHSRAASCPTTPQHLTPAQHAWAWLNALDLALTYQTKVRLPMLTGKVVIADRYTTDAAVEIAHRLGVDDPMSIPAVRALIALSPKPDAAYLLDAPAEIAAFRSADPEDVDDLAQQRELYRRAASDARLSILDVSGNFGDANDRLVREALQQYEDSFATLTNGLLLSNPDQLNPQERGIWSRSAPPELEALHKFLPRPATDLQEDAA